MGFIFKIFGVSPFLRSFDNGAKGVSRSIKTNAFKNFFFVLAFAIGFIGLATIVISDFQLLDTNQISILSNVIAFVLIVPVCGYAGSFIFIDKKAAIKRYLIKQLRSPRLADRPSKQSISEDKVSVSNTYPTDFRPPRNTPDA